MEFITEKRMGDPVSAGEFAVYPISKTAALLPKGDSGGLIWNRPHAILVRGQNGEEHFLRIRDVTREKQLLLLGLGLLGAFLLWLVHKT